MSRRVLTVVAALAVAASTFACSRTTAVTRGSLGHARGATAAADEHGWRVGCDAFCDLDARAPTLDELCAKILDRAPPGTVCKAETPLGVGDRSIAIHDAARLEMRRADRRWTLLAVSTDLGWSFARELGGVGNGVGDGLTVLGAKPVDVAGLEPAALAVRVDLSRDGAHSERLFVCGVRGDGAVACPLAAVVARRASAASPFTAGLAIPATDDGWRVDVELGPQGFVATRASGEPPADQAAIVGEHAWAEAR